MNTFTTDRQMDYGIIGRNQAFPLELESVTVQLLYYAALSTWGMWSAWTVYWTGFQATRFYSLLLCGWNQM